MEKSCKTCRWNLPDKDCIKARNEAGSYKGVCHMNYEQWQPKQPNKPIEPIKKLVTIPKNVAEAIKTVREAYPHYTVAGMTNWSSHQKYFNNKISESLRKYFEQHPHEYIRAIQEGYQVELTPKEQILELRDMYSRNIANYKGGNLANLSEWKVSKKLLEQVIKIMGWEVE